MSTRARSFVLSDYEVWIRGYDVSMVFDDSDGLRKSRNFSILNIDKIAF